MTPTPLRRFMFKAGAILLLLCVGYALAFVRSQRQVDGFCARVTTDTAVADLSMIAKDVGGAKLIGPSVIDGAHVVASVVNPLTMGDYACTVEAASMTGKVETKHLGYR